MATSSHRCAAFFLLSLLLTACGDGSAPPLAGTWTGANARGPITFVVRDDGAFVLTIDHEDLPGEPQRELGTLRRTEDFVYLDVADYEPVELCAPFRRAGIVLCLSRVRREGDALLLEREQIPRSIVDSPRVEEEVWLRIARLTREGR